MWQYMAHHNALEFLRVNFVYPTGFLLCDLSRHADFRDALTISWSDEPQFSYLPPIWPVLLRVDFNSYSGSRFLFLTITQQFTLESWCNEQLNEDPNDWQNMLTIKRGLNCYIEVPFIYCTVKARSSMETRSIQTSHCYGQFALSLGKESPFIFYPLNKVTPLIRTLSQYGPFSVGICGVWLYYFWGGEYRLLLKIESLENAILELWLA